MSDRVRHRRYGPHVIAVAHFIAPDIGSDLIELLHRVDDRWPDLSVRDLIGAMAETLAMQPKGYA